MSGKRTSIEVPKELWAAVKQAAELADQTLPGYTVQALRERLEREKAQETQDADSKPAA